MKKHFLQWPTLLGFLLLGSTGRLWSQPTWVGTPNVYAITSNTDYFHDMVLDNVGRMVCVGYRLYNSSGAFEIRAFNLRLNQDFTPDLSYSPNGGVRTLTIGGSSTYAYGVAIQSDNKILMCGNSIDGPYVARLNEDGTLDNSFDGDGIAVLGGTGGTFYDVHYDAATGKIIAAGNYAVDGNSTGFLAVRFTALGQKDFTFNNDGVFNYSFWDDDEPGIKKIVQNPDGSYWMCGSSNPDGTTNHDAVVMKLTSSGFLDGTSADGGFWISFASGDDYFNDMIRLSNGNILMVGHVYSSPDHYIWLRLCDASGNYITGSYISQLGDASKVNGWSLAEQCDGKVVVLAEPEGSSTVLFRINPSNLSIDASFGFFEAQIGYADYPRVLLSENEQLYVGGQLYPNSSNFYYDVFVGKLNNPITIAAPTIVIAPSNPNTTNYICPGADKVLIASGNCPSCTVEWYVAGNPNPVDTGISFIANSAGAYTAKYKNPGCGSSVASNSIILQTGTVPVTPTVTPPADATVCTGSSYQLTASGSGTGVTYIWQPPGSGSGSVININTAVPGVKTYYANAQHNASLCLSPNSNSVAVTVVQPTNQAPVIFPSGTITLCNGQSAILNVTNSVPPNHTVLWSNGLTGTTIPVDADGTYTAQFVQGNCGGPNSAAVTVNVVSPPTPAVTASSFTICDAPVTLTASGCAGCSVTWYENGSPVSFDNPFLAYHPEEYYAVYNQNGCLGPVSVTLALQQGMLPIPNPPSVTPVGPLTVCAGETETLTVQNTGGNFVTWYQNGIPLAGQTGASVQVSTSGSYYCILSNGVCSSQPSDPVVVTSVQFTATIDADVCVLCAPPGSSYAWYLDNQFIPGATEQCWTVLTAGIYTVSLIDASGCTGFTPAVFAQPCVSALEGIEGIGGLRVFPNPSRGQVVFELHASLPAQFAIELFTADGRPAGEVFEGFLPAGTKTVIFPSGHLPPGSYIFQIRTENRTTTGKLIIVP